MNLLCWGTGIPRGFLWYVFHMAITFWKWMIWSTLFIGMCSYCSDIFCYWHTARLFSSPCHFLLSSLYLNHTCVEISNLLWKECGCNQLWVVSGSWIHSGHVLLLLSSMPRLFEEREMQIIFCNFFLHYFYSLLACHILGKAHPYNRLIGTKMVTVRKKIFLQKLEFR